MKYIFHSLLLLSILSLPACHDDSSSPAQPVADKTFDASSGLVLTYNGSPMPGKSVAFHQDGDKASLTAFSTFDLSQLSAFGLSGSLPSPGIIPGSTSTVWNVNLSDNDGQWVFEGSDKNDFCTYSYSGAVSKGRLIINISDAKLIQAPITPAAWSPLPLQKNADGSLKSSPIFIDWQYDPIPGMDINLSQILQALTVLPVIPVYDNTAYMSLAEAFSLTVKAVAFRPDGNILITYVSQTGGSAHIAQTNPNGLQYVGLLPGVMNLYVNPLSLAGFILENTSGGTPQSEIDLTGTGLYPTGGSSSTTATPTLPKLSPIALKLLQPVLQTILPMVAEGIPMAYNVASDRLILFADTQMNLTLMEKVFSAALSDPEIMKALGQYIASDPNLAPLLPYVEKLPQILQAALQQTTVFRIGFAFSPYQG